MGKDKNESLINITPLIDYLKTRDIQHVNGTDPNFRSALRIALNRSVLRVAPKSTQTQLSSKAVKKLIEHFEKDPKLSLIERDKIYQKLALLEISARKKSKNYPVELEPYVNSYGTYASYINTTSIPDILNPEEAPHISIDTLNGLVEHYKRREFLEETDPEKRQAKLEEVFEKIAALAHIGGKKTKFPPELTSYMEAYNKIEIRDVQQALDGDQNGELRNFTLAFKGQIDKTIVQENEATPQNLQDRRFDSLSRLIAHGSQCSAVCFSGEKILVAFNELHAGNKNSDNSINNGIKTHTAEVFEYLKDYALYAKLPTEKEQEEFLTTKDLPNRRQKLLVNAAQHYYSNNTKHKELLQYILQGLDENNEAAIKLYTVSDEITAAAIRARKDLMKLEDALTPSTDKDKQFDQKIINALIERPQPYEIILDGPHDSKAHAEMRIVEYIEKRIKELKSSPIQDPNNQLRSNIYIGLSKLCCINCNLAINKDKKLEFVFNANNGATLTIPIDSTEGKVTINSTRGSHGEGFEWALVEAVTNNPEFLENFLGKKAYEHYTNLVKSDKENNKQQADIALKGVVRYIAQGKLKINKKEIKIEPKKTINPTKTKESFAGQYAYNSGTDADEKNEPRKKIIAATVYDSTFPAAPIIPTIQPNVNTTLDAVLEEIRKLQADLAHAQENAMKNLSADGLYRELLRHPDVSVEFLQLLISEKQQPNKGKGANSKSNGITAKDKENAYNKKNDNRYLYEARDIKTIAPELIDETKTNLAIFFQDQNNPNHERSSDNIKNIQESFPKLTKEKPIIGIYNIPGEIGHWTSFAILKDENDQVVLLYKDSMGGDCPKDIQKAAEMYSNGKTVKPIVNNSKEQGGSSTDKGVDVNCGIYALKNAQIIYDNITNSEKREDFIKNFKNQEFCSLNEAQAARVDEFARRYVIGLYNTLLDEEIKHGLKEHIYDHHKEELKTIQTILGTENCEILDHSFSTTEHTEPKLYLDLVGIEEKSGEYNYKYQISTPISNAKAAKEQLEKVLGISYDESKENKPIGGVSYTVTPDEIKTPIKLKPHIEKKDIEEIKITLKAAWIDDVVDRLPDSLYALDSKVNIKEIIEAYTGKSQTLSLPQPSQRSPKSSEENKDMPIAHSPSLGRKRI